MEKLHIKNFGPIKEIDVEFGDLTILVGQQASGKSIALETLKLVVDKNHIVNVLNGYNYVVDCNIDIFFDVYYGEGMASMWNEKSEIVYDDNEFSAETLCEESPNEGEKILYIPAHRILSLSDGRPKNFMEFDNSTPYVLRSFSENLRLFMQQGLNNNKVIFPMKDSHLKDFMRNSFDSAIFHKAQVVIEEGDKQKKIKLNIGKSSVPFLAWSTGQREFMPLLMSFYRLLGSNTPRSNNVNYKYVIIEEPEMGLHLKAIVSIILQILELIKLKYKVIVSTHSPVFLEFAWALNVLKGNETGKYEALYEIFGEEQSVKNILKGLFDKDIKTYYFGQDSETGKVTSRDISSLDATDDCDLIADWGGLSDFSTKVSEVVSKYMSEND